MNTAEAQELPEITEEMIDEFGRALISDDPGDSGSSEHEAES